MFPSISNERRTVIYNRELIINVDKIFRSPVFKEVYNERKGTFHCRTKLCHDLCIFRNAIFHIIFVFILICSSYCKFFSSDFLIFIHHLQGIQIILDGM